MAPLRPPGALHVTRIILAALRPAAHMPPKRQVAAAAGAKAPKKSKTSSAAEKAKEAPSKPAALVDIEDCCFTEQEVAQVGVNDVISGAALC